MSEWEPWRYEGSPQVGDYVQIVLICVCGEKKTVEGIVTISDAEKVKIAPIPEVDLCCFDIECWRRKKPPSIELEEDRELEMV